MVHSLYTPALRHASSLVRLSPVWSTPDLIARKEGITSAQTRNLNRSVAVVHDH